jgi:hypothetical protein
VTSATATALDRHELPSAAGESPLAGIRRRRLEQVCENAGWVYSRRLRCLDFDWSILTNDAALADYITYLYEASVIGSPGAAPHVFIVHRHTSAETGSVSVHRDRRAVLRRAPADVAIAQVVWEVNRGVVEASHDRLLLHAAAAERDGRVVVLAGPEGSGKSTLVDALVRSGLRYVTDETVAVTRQVAHIAPYPKPIALHETHGSRLVPPQAIRHDAVALSGGDPAMLVLLSGYRAGSATAAREIPRSEAAVALAEQAFNFRDLGPGRLDTTAELVRKCVCYRLDVGDLDAGCRLVRDLFDATGAAA